MDGLSLLVLLGVLMLVLARYAIWIGTERRLAELPLLKILAMTSIILPVVWPFAMAFALFGETCDD